MKAIEAFIVYTSVKTTTPQANLPPAFPVFKLSSCPPFPRPFFRLALGLRRASLRRAKCNTRFIAEAVMPDLLHIILIINDSMFNWVFQNQNSSFRLCLVTNIRLFLSHSNRYTSVMWTTYNVRAHFLQIQPSPFRFCYRKRRVEYLQILLLLFLCEKEIQLRRNEEVYVGMCVCWFCIVFWFRIVWIVFNSDFGLEFSTQNC